MKPKISIITCTYWRPDLLSRCIQSVQKSTLKEYEHIIVGDHDPFVKAVYNDYKDDDRIKYYEAPGEYEYNLGAVAFNLGIKKAKSDFICYALDDDIIRDNHLQSNYDLLKDGKHSAMLSPTAVAVIPNGKRNVKDICSCSYKQIESYISKHQPVDVAGLFHRKDVTEKWITQKQLGRGKPEDDNYIKRLKTKSTNSDTTIKVSWNGHGQEDTNGTDKSYYNALMKKLVKDERTQSGYRLTDKSPYVYPELKGMLYEDK